MEPPTVFAISVRSRDKYLTASDWVVKNFRPCPAPSVPRLRRLYSVLRHIRWYRHHVCGATPRVGWARVPLVSRVRIPTMRTAAFVYNITPSDAPSLRAPTTSRSRRIRGILVAPSFRRSSRYIRCWRTADFRYPRGGVNKASDSTEGNRFSREEFVFAIRTAMPQASSQISCPRLTTCMDTLWVSAGWQPALGWTRRSRAPCSSGLRAKLRGSRMKSAMRLVLVR